MDKATMDVIMQERIEKFNQFVMEQDIDKMPIGLFDGKMGICIYFYHQARLTQNKKFKEFAERLLDSIYSEIHLQNVIDMEDGLAGICYGINYLIEQHFVKGNVNSILKEVDDKIYSSFCFNILSNNSVMQIENLRTILQLTIYFYNRLQSNNLPANEKYLFENIIIKAINKIENVTLADKFTEPFVFSIRSYFLPSYLILLSKLYELDLYNYKIEKIFDELSDKLRSTYPLLQSNRLFLSGGMRNVEKIKSVYGWKDHSMLLEQNTDFSSIIEEEFRNKNIFPSDGLSGFYFLAKYLHASININYDLLSQKIVMSDVWNEHLIDHEKLKTRIGLVSGFSGVIIAYQDIQNNQ
jgi:hypothetical protein